MGEAKRRKKLDPNYGQLKPPVEVELATIPLPAYEGELLPDFGAYCLQQFGDRPISLAPLTHCSVMVQGNEGYIHFNASGYMATIITTAEMALSYKDQPFPLVVKPNLRQRYLTQETQEWVVPFFLVD
jgi:hypothetical protein